MALTKKQVKQLRGMGQRINPLIAIGKNDITETLIDQADETIEKRELVKFTVQDGSMLTAREASEKLAEALHAEVIQVIGNRFVLFRRSLRKDVEHIALVRE
ncbi:YhbY family RNA-binding protein [Bifidobacterium magnum]|uniref:RNA-binding protein n=1 Tax=Bifidobacterium magnum TaxID=1692 RepID=A0A087BCU9_9BIFI|nr:YhbY family RNA-binding protein [Bifidobacterium magnum]KFI68849.1 RNA-binding protein [Bifidobacterium magnum]